MAGIGVDCGLSTQYTLKSLNCNTDRYKYMRVTIHMAHGMYCSLAKAPGPVIEYEKKGLTHNIRTSCSASWWQVQVVRNHVR